MKKRISFVFVLLFFYSTVYAQFANITESAGIDHSCRSGSLIGGGVAFLDVDMDGWVDLIMTGGTEPDRVYINQRDKTFKEESFRLRHNAYKNSTTSAVAIGDVDLDGCADLLFTTLNSGRPNILLKNNCDGTFVEITSFANLVETAQSTGALFYDFNKDGLQDIYVYNYVKEYQFILDDQGAVIGYDHQCFPNFLYINNGDLTFTESSNDYNLDSEACTLAGIAHDSPSREPTLYIANDFGEWIWPNERLVFDTTAQNAADIAPSISMDIGLYGMGVAITDFNFDGLPDYYVTNIGSNVLLENQMGIYYEKAHELGVDVSMTNEGQNRTSWGAMFFDYDNDGDDDLYVANGDVGSADFLNVTKSEMNSFFEFDSDRYHEVIDPDFTIEGKSRGVAYGDIDNDGDLDICVARVGIYQDQPSATDKYQLLENIAANSNNYLTIAAKDMDGSIPFGLEVKVYTDSQIFTQILYSGGSYASQSELKLHFGLGPKNLVDSIKFVWPNGEKMNFYEVPTNQQLAIFQEEKKLLVVGCTDMSSPDFNPMADYARECTTDRTTGIVSLDEIRLNAFPNPIQNQIFISNEDRFDISEIRIHDMIGTLILSKEINNSNQLIKLDFSSAAKGAYVISILDQSGKTIVTKSIKH